MSGLKRKYLVWSGLGGMILLGAVGLLFYFCTDGFTTLVGVSAKNLSALYSTGDLKSLWWREMSAFAERPRGGGGSPAFLRTSRRISALTSKLMAEESGERQSKLREFERIHVRVIDLVRRGEVGPATSTLYGAGAERLTEFGDAVLLGSQAEQSQLIRRTNLLMKLAFLGAIACKVFILLGSFLFFRKQILDPITVISAASLLVARGEFHPLPMDFHEDEIGVLATNFNRMVEEIRLGSDRIRTERDHAELANRAKSAFLANMSHELRTPMHGILSFARFGQQKFDTVPKERLKSYFDEIHASGARLMGLLDDILDLSKLEAGKISYSMKTHDLRAAIETVANEMKAFAEECGIGIELSGPSGVAVGTFDHERVMQVLRNLLSNAIKFSRAGKSVGMKVARIADTLECRVVNLGVGIPRAELETIFDKFVQSSRTQTGAGGTGLGLAICREIVIQHGGRIWAESDPLGKTTFIVHLPVTPAQLAGTRAA